MKTPFNPFEMAQAQFDRAAAILELDEATRDLLRWPLREYSFDIPVRMSGDIKGTPGAMLMGRSARDELHGMDLVEDEG